MSSDRRPPSKKTPTRGARQATEQSPRQGRSTHTPAGLNEHSARRNPAHSQGRPTQTTAEVDDRSDGLNPNHPKSQREAPPRIKPARNEREAQRAHDEFLEELARTKGEGFSWSDD